MKPKLFLLFTILISTATYAQVNLVPNPSFEDTIYCPNATNQIDACANWLNFGNSPDYFNACDPTGLNVPNSSFGFQYAHTGNAMAGVITYRRPNLPTGPNYREFIGCQLSSPLIIGQKYFFSFFANFSNPGIVGIASNKVGLNFSTVLFDSSITPPILNFSNLYADSIIQDTINWSFLHNSFVADSAYQYISIGNFFDDLNTDTINVGQFPDATYYYIDDVCVSTDSLFNQTWTGLKNNNFLSIPILVYPNPANNFLKITSKNKIDNLKILNLFGELIIEKKIVENLECSINVSNFDCGIYILKISIYDQIISKKIFINH